MENGPLVLPLHKQYDRWDYLYVLWVYIEIKIVCVALFRDSMSQFKDSLQNIDLFTQINETCHEDSAILIMSVILLSFREKISVFQTSNN